MDLELSEEQHALADAVRRAAGDLSAARAVHEGAAFDRARWRDLVELGTTGLFAPAGADGLELGTVEAAVIAEQLGRVADPTPWVAAGVAAATIGDPEVTAAIAHGDTIAVAAELPDPIEGHEATVACRGVAGAAVADVLLATHGDEAWVVPLSGDRVTISARAGTDPTRFSADLDLTNAPAKPAEVEPGATARARLRRDAALVADGLGAATAALEMTLEYARVREQFGVAIGSFQAVQHLCADMLVDLELTRGGSLRAAWAIDAADAATARHDVAVAVAQAAEALPRVTERAIQVHGGIGMTWEHDLHLLHARVVSMQQLLGGTRHALDQLAAVIEPGR